MRINFQNIQWLIKAILIGIADVSWISSLVFASVWLYNTGSAWSEPIFTALNHWLSQPGWFGITPNLLFPILARPDLTDALQHQSLDLAIILSIATITYLFVSLRTFILSKDLPYSFAVWRNNRRIERLERQLQQSADLAETIEIMEMGRSDRNRVVFNISIDLQRIYQQLQEK